MSCSSPTRSRFGRSDVRDGGQFDLRMTGKPGRVNAAAHAPATNQSGSEFCHGQMPCGRAPQVAAPALLFDGLLAFAVEQSDSIWLRTYPDGLAGLTGKRGFRSRLDPRVLVE